MADQNDDNDGTTATPEALSPTAPEETPEEATAEPAAETSETSEASAAEEPEPEPEAEPEPEPEPEPASPFGAQFSSPEPTAVVARPRRRATRPAAAADPGSVEPVAPPAPAIPAFVSFVAPDAEVAPVPRRRSRRTVAESPEIEDVEAPAEEDEESAPPRARRSRSRRRPEAEDAETTAVEDVEDVEESEDTEDVEEEDRDEAATSGSRRRRRGRRGRGRGRTSEDGDIDEGTDEARDEQADEDAEDETGEEPDEDGEGEEAETGSSTRRRRRRRRRGSSEDRGETGEEERPERAGRDGRTTSDDDVRGVTGSTRLEAKRQRRRDGRDSGRRRAPILTESEFLARREAVDRKMVIRQRGERTQIAVLEDDILVEHYVTQAQATSFAGNVYLGRVQNVLPSMEAAFVDIGKGRNAVLYAGEVNWDAAGLSGKQRSIEQALKSGDKVLVQVTKDPIGHKGARLTQQINLPGRFLVYVPGGSMTGISRKLPDTERQRLKDILKKIVPEDAGVIIRTAAEGASEEELTRDVNRLKAQWEVISKKAESNSNAPTLLYGEPDLAIRVIRDVFNEDFKELVVSGDDAWDTVEAYVAHVSPELVGRLTRYTGTGDVFSDLRIDEQLAKALDRKVWLPSGGSLVIDRTEAMTVVDVNTGKFVGSGGNLEQTVTRNNMEAAEEIVRQLRLRDIGGIIVIDFIDMVLESNRDLVLRRLTECLGRDRTKHQVAEVTSLGLVQMTRKRVGQGLLEVFSEPCEHCRGRGVIVHTDPVDERRRGGNGGGNGRRDSGRAERPPAKETVEVEAASPNGGPQAEEDGEVARTGGGRRNRGRRNRGQSGEERAAEDAAVLTAIRDEPVAEEAPAEATIVEEAPAEEPPAEEPPAEEAPVEEPQVEEAVAVPEPEAEVEIPGETAAVTADAEFDPGTGSAEVLAPAAEASADDEISPEVGAVPRPRRRRAASRPAGPPA
ncbi:Rne/Rng family ribonuclease [Geodermatophilus sp. URMC 64]